MDRDGTIIVDKHYLSSPEQIEFLPGVFQVLRQFQSLGFLLFLVTNQSGIARGYFTEETYQQVNQRFLQLLNEQNVFIQEVRYCPHHPTAVISSLAVKCYCRKPEPGMILELAEKYQIDLKQSYMIGDRDTDLQAGRRAGCMTVNVTDDYFWLTILHSNDFNKALNKFVITD